MGIDDDIRAADRLLESNCLTEAEECYRALLKADPVTWEVRCYFGLARCARARGAHTEAAELFRRVAEMVPTEVARWNSVAEDLRAAGRYVDAVQIYRNVLDKLPDNVSTLGGLGYCLRLTGEREAALGYFQSAAEREAGNPRWLMEIATELQALGRLDDQAGVYRQVLSLKSDYREAQCGLLRIVREREGRDASRAYCREVLAATPDADWARLELTDDLLALERYEEAESEFTRLLQNSCVEARIFLGLGLCARQRGDRAAMFSHFNAAAEQSPNDFAPRGEIATAHRNAGAFDAARDIVMRFLREPGGKIPDQACQAEINLALTERAAGQHDVSLAAFHRAHLLSPNHIGILVEMAGTEKRLGQFDDCLAHLRMALRVNPANSDAVRVMAEVLQAVGDIDSAYQLYRDAVARNPADINLQLGLADVLKAIGQTVQAVETLASLEDGHGLMPRVRVKRIDLERERGFYAEALFLAREATTQMPKNFEICRSRFNCERLYANNPGVEESILQMRPATQFEKARKLLSQGLAMEAAMQFDDAQFYYEAAATLAPEDREIQNNLTRLKLITFDLEGATQHLRLATSLEASSRQLEGKSQSISQSFFGQLIDEFRMDAGAVKHLKSLRIFPPAERAAAVLKLVPDYSNNTGVATMLLVAMRQAGGMRFQPRADAVPIPRFIHQFWDTEAPGEIQELMHSWQAHNPDWRVTCFDQTSASAYIERFFGQPVLTAFLRAREPAMKADIFRLAVLAREGGVYADADDRCQAPLAPLLPEGADLVLYQEDVCTIGNNFMAAAPGHEFIMAALRAAVDAVNRGDTDLLWLTTGPGLVSRVFVEIIAATGRCDILPLGMVVLHRNEILPTVAMHCFVAYKKTRTHWTEGNFAQRRRLVVDSRPQGPSISCDMS